MADENTRRSYRSNDPYRQAAELPRPDEQSSDPLAELARLIGRADPFAELGRNQPRQQGSQPPASPDDWGSARDDYASRDAQHSQQDSYREPYQDSQRESFQDDSRYGFGAEGRRQDAYDDDRFQQDSQSYQDEGRGYSDDPRQHGRGYDDHDQQHGYDQNHGHEHGQHYANGDEADQYYEDDAPLSPYEDEMYDDAPRARRRGGLATALALIGCAVLGTAGAYAYRSYTGQPGSLQTPPVITADSSTPTKIVPSANADQQSSKAIQDRIATAGKEQIVPKQEEPVALKDIETQSSPRGVLPAPAAPVAGGLGGVSTEPRKIRTERIRPDGNDASGRPVGTLPPAATTRSAPAPAPKAAGTPARGGGPISLDPPAGDPPAERSTRSAALPPPTRAAPEPANTSGGIAVSLSSQKSEADAQASFRTLQAKFPNELGSRQPIIRRVDLGSKGGVVYRAMVGPFASAQEASQFCTAYKAGGGQCFIPKD